VALVEFVVFVVGGRPALRKVLEEDAGSGRV
jgi:hypothetical protein